MLQGYKTYIGIGITSLGWASSTFGWGLGDLGGVQSPLIELVGLLLSIYGRAAAKPIK